MRFYAVGRRGRKLHAVALGFGGLARQGGYTYTYMMHTCFFFLFLFQGLCLVLVYKIEERWREEEVEGKGRCT